VGYELYHALKGKIRSLDNTATDQPQIRDRQVRGAKRPGRHQRRAVARQAGDAVDAGGLERFCQSHGRQDGGEAPRQPRRARPRGTKE
jgi:hypothetical protein